jgi:hypothetical protein
MEILQNIFDHAKPLGHNESRGDFNLGFGYLYYGMVRAVRPYHILVIGSGYGFSVVCLALGLKDNNKGLLSFVDPSYNVLKHGPLKTVGGRGKWDDPKDVKRHFRRFGVDDIVIHYKMTSEEFFHRYPSLGLPDIDIAFIDGNHSFKNVKYDFASILEHSRKNTYIFLHDTHIYIRELIGEAGVKRWLKKVRKNLSCFEVINFPFSSGVAVVRVLRENAWESLSR